MSDDEELKGREAFERIFGALFTAGGEVAKAFPGVEHDLPLRGGLAVVLPVMGFAVGRGLHRAFIGRRKTFAKGYVNAFEGDPDKAAAHGEQHRDDDNYNERMYRAFRAMLDAADPSVVETLGYLAGQYSFADKPVDADFRNLGRLLCDLEGGELQQFKTLLRAVHLHLSQVSLDAVNIIRSDAMGGPASIGHLHALKPPLGIGTKMQNGDFVRFGDFSSGRRLFGLMIRSEFAIEHPTPGGNQTMTLSKDVVEWLLTVLDPQPV